MPRSSNEFVLTESTSVVPRGSVGFQARQKLLWNHNFHYSKSNWGMKNWMRAFSVVASRVLATLQPTLLVFNCNNPPPHSRSASKVPIWVFFTSPILCFTVTGCTAQFTIRLVALRARVIIKRSNCFAHNSCAMSYDAGATISDYLKKGRLHTD